MFNDKYGLTDAVLKGRKTMTRRIVGNRMTEDDIKAYLKGYTELANKCAYYKIGDVVAVAQAYRDCNNNQEMRFDDEFGTKSWNNKMFVCADLMPHQIRITDIKIERLQDISDEDCFKEGIMVHPGWPAMSDLYVFQGRTPLENYLTPREAFAALIDKISGKGTWDQNDWQLAYSFKLVK